MRLSPLRRDRPQYTVNRFHGLFDLVVHDAVVERPGFLQLATRRGEPFPQAGGVLGPPPGQTGLELLPRGRLDEDRYRLGERTLKLVGALDVDLEKDVLPFTEQLLDRGSRRPVELAVHLSPFEQLAGVPPPLEVLAAHVLIRLGAT